MSNIKLNYKISDNINSYIQKKGVRLTLIEKTVEQILNVDRHAGVADLNLLLASHQSFVTYF